MTSADLTSRLTDYKLTPCNTFPLQNYCRPVILTSRNAWYHIVLRRGVRSVKLSLTNTLHVRTFKIILRCPVTLIPCCSVSWLA